MCDSEYCMIFRSPHLQAAFFLCETHSVSIVISSAVGSFVHGLQFPTVYSCIVNGIYGKWYSLSMCLSGKRYATWQTRYIVMEERYNHVDSDRKRRNTTHFTNTSKPSLLHFVCFPDVAVAHDQQVSTLVWSASDHTVGKAIGGSICARNA